jgi:hypothetical protein
MFNVHLEGVRSIIEMSGGADVLIPKMPKLRAQLAMFIWYYSYLPVQNALLTRLKV